MLGIDYDEAAKVPGVHAILTAKDIPGENQLGPVIHDEPCLANDELNCIGQAICLMQLNRRKLHDMLPD
ncbi:MAG: hypothetical protein IPH88_15560 [Bacteroidales bacterium]|nr:hypothetical protein [Bacteroidales bacterium]